MVDVAAHLRLMQGALNTVMHVLQHAPVPVALSSPCLQRALPPVDWELLRASCVTYDSSLVTPGCGVAGFFARALELSGMVLT